MAKPIRYDHHKEYWDYFESVGNHEAAAILYHADVMWEIFQKVDSLLHAFNKAQVQEPTAPKVQHTAQTNQKHSFTVELPPMVFSAKQTPDEEEAES
jgi:hypothetical protein